MKIQKEAKLVFKGAIFNVYQWRQKMYDGSVVTFECLTRPSTVQVIPTSDEKIYLSYEEQPTKSPAFTLFGGRLEEGEAPLVAARRELLEETGLESSDWELLKVFEQEGKIDWTLYLYIARNCNKVAQQHLDGGEKIEIKEVNFEEFVKIVSREDFWGQMISTYILRMRLDKNRLEAFRRKLFGK